MVRDELNPAKRIDTADLVSAGNELAQREASFSEILLRHGHPPLMSRAPGLASLVRIILEQQVSLEAARTLYRRLEAAAGGILVENLLALGVEGLRAAGLTGQKARYCHELAARVRDGRTSFHRIARADDAVARALLREIPGVGPWSADVYLLFVARRPDIWPPGDLALRRSIAETFELDETPDDRRCLAMAEEWRPWRSVAARLLWHAYLSRRGRSDGLRRRTPRGH